MKITRKQTVLGVSGLVVIVLVLWGVLQIFPRLFNPYAGLVTTIDVQMDDATRALITQRLETTLASIAASEKAGEDVDMNSYLVVAENYHYLGDLIHSRETYEKYLEFNPISYVAWNSYGSILETMGDYEKAGPAYQKAIENLEAEEYYRDYAEFLKAHYPEKTVEYKKVLDDAYTSLGQTSWTMIALGDWYFDHRDCEQGVAHYSVAATISPENENIVLDQQEKNAVCTVK